MSDKTKFCLTCGIERVSYIDICNEHIEICKVRQFDNWKFEEDFQYPFPFYFYDDDNPWSFVQLPPNFVGM